MNNHFYFHRFLQYLIPALLVASIFFPSNILEKSVFEEIKCKNGHSYTFRPFNLPEEGYAWFDCDSGLHTGNAEDYSKDLINKFSTSLDDEWEIAEIVPDVQSRVELIGLTSEYKIIERGLDIKRLGELFSPRLPIIAIIISSIAFLGTFLVPAKGDTKGNKGGDDELIEAVLFALLIGGILVVALVFGYKTWLSWLEPKVSDFRLWRSTFFSRNIYWIKPLSLSIGILIASLVTVEFIEDIKRKGFKQSLKDIWIRNTRSDQEKKIEFPPLKLSSLKETWSGKVVIGITITLIVMIIIAVFVGLIGQ